jgi:hypothetical protein
MYASKHNKKETDITTIQNHKKLKKRGEGITARTSEDSKEHPNIPF